MPPIVMTTLAIGTFLVEHGDMIEAILAAFGAGTSKAEVMAGIRASMITASDAAVFAELGPRETEPVTLRGGGT
jgi:hypothetical protein